MIWDLENLPLPFSDDCADEIHAYHILEHTGWQGDAKFFFAQFEDFWRILKPLACFHGIVPAHDSRWAWADPGHKRVITVDTLGFLDRDKYGWEVGHTAVSDYRGMYKGSLKTVYAEIKGDEFAFVLQAIK